MHNLEHLMVHRPPMLLLDELVETGTSHAISRVSIHPHTLFADEHGLPVWVGMELMAQTVCLLAGVRGQAQQQAPQIGFLLGTRQYHANFSHFQFGDELSIRVDESFVDDNLLGQYDCQIHCQSGSIVAKLNVYQPSNAHDLLKEVF